MFNVQCSIFNLQFSIFNFVDIFLPQRAQRNTEFFLFQYSIFNIQCSIFNFQFSILNVKYFLNTKHTKKFSQRTQRFFIVNY
jgi:hypothetical protein